MAGIYAITILLVLYFVGDFVAMKTKGLLSSIFVLCVVMMIGYWAGLPKDIVNLSGVAGIGSTMVGIIVAGIGTTIDLPELKRQWKTVVISLLGVVLAVGSIILIGSRIIGWNEAVSSAPIFAGAAVALLVVNSALAELGLMETLGVIVITVYATQKFIGVPLASFCLQKEAKTFITDRKQVEYYAALNNENTTDHGTRKRPLAFFSTINKPSLVMAKLALVMALSYFLSSLTGGKIHHLVIVLIMGILFMELGFLPKNALGKTDSNFLLTFALITSVFSSLSNVTPSILMNNLVPVLLVLLIGCFGVVIAGVICGKIFKMGIGLCIALGITCTFGFPTTMLLSTEIAEGVGTTEDEVQALKNYLIPKMTVAGFVTVTIASVVLAGMVVPLLR